MSDVPALAELGREFFSMSEFANLTEYDVASMHGTLTGFIQHPELIGLFVIEREGRVVGAAAMVNTPLFFNHGVTSAHEFFWYVAEEARGGFDAIRLLSRCEAWAKEQGCSLVSMTALACNAGVGELYERRGYTPQETNFIKRLQ